MLGHLPHRGVCFLPPLPMSYYFCIVGTRDNLLYEADLSPPSTTSAGGAQEAESQRTSSVFGFTSALGQWTGGFPLLPTADPTDEVKREESKFTSTSTATNERHLLQMIAHGSLDSLEDRQFLESNMYVLCPDVAAISKTWTGSTIGTCLYFSCPAVCVPLLT